MKLRDLLCGKSYWKTQSSVWFDEIRKVYRPHRMCVKCGQISRWATKYCPHCGRHMTHETIPTAYIPTKEVKVAPLNNRWITLQKEEEEWAERLHRGVPVEEVRRHEKAEKMGEKRCRD